jgi:hypothetical protein
MVIQFIVMLPIIQDCNDTSYTDRNDKFYSSWAGEIYWGDYPYGNAVTQNPWPFYAVA